MRVYVRYSIATIAMGWAGAAWGQFDNRSSKADQPTDEIVKGTQLSLDDIRAMRGKHASAEKVVDALAEQGRGFDVDAEAEAALRKLGFNAAQLAAIKDASPDPLVPGKFLASKEADRDATMDLMQRVATKSGASIQPAQTVHVTLWAAKDIQKTYLADIQKAEKYFHTKCAEPIRSGLDKRTSHIVLVSNYAEYRAWWRALFELNPKAMEVKYNPGYTAQIRQQVLLTPVVSTSAFTIVCTGVIGTAWTSRCVADSVGYQCVSQLIGRQSMAIQAGFGNCTEAAVCGFPAFSGSTPEYQKEIERGVLIHDDWGLLVKQLASKHKSTPLADLLKADLAPNSQSLSAERWSLVGLLNRQPAKFGKLIQAIGQGDSELAAIQKTYGWDEKELSRQLRVYGMSQGKHTATAAQTAGAEKR